MEFVLNTDILFVLSNRVELDGRLECTKKVRSGDFQGVIAITAFGLGIDEADVVLVIQTSGEEFLPPSYLKSCH